MKIKFIQTGKTTEKYLLSGINEFKKRLSRYSKIQLIEIPDLKNTKSLTPEQVKFNESEQQIKFIEKNDYLILLDENGKSFTSIEFAKYIQNKGVSGFGQLCFLIGGAFGFHESIYKIASDKISLSPMTFNHQVIRLVFMEQLYRAISIINGLPYHNE